MHFCKFSLSLADPPGRGPTRLGTSGDGWQIQREKIENIKSTSETPSLTVETTVSPGWLGLVFPNKEEDKPVVDGNTPSHHHTITPVVFTVPGPAGHSVCLLAFVILEPPQP